mmetsp:Transcript_23629/g.43888  ORF Transcript_23629/g.43888 Transcript_23629/m.43888 type:complete len:1164 (+) Transcript_23629:320-3811(+)
MQQPQGGAARGMPGQGVPGQPRPAMSGQQPVGQQRGPQMGQQMGNVVQGMGAMSMGNGAQRPMGTGMPRGPAGQVAARPMQVTARPMAPQQRPQVQQQQQQQRPLTTGSAAPIRPQGPVPAGQPQQMRAPGNAPRGPVAGGQRPPTPGSGGRPNGFQQQPMPGMPARGPTQNAMNQRPGQQPQTGQRPQSAAAQPQMGQRPPSAAGQPQIGQRPPSAASQPQMGQRPPSAAGQTQMGQKPQGMPPSQLQQQRPPSAAGQPRPMQTPNMPPAGTGMGMGQRPPTPGGPPMQGQPVMGRGAPQGFSGQANQQPPPPGPGGVGMQRPPSSGGFPPQAGGAMPPPPMSGTGNGNLGGNFQQRPPPPSNSMPQGQGMNQQNFHQQQAAPGMQQQQPSSYIDPSSLCDKRFMRSTFGSFPASDALRQQSTLSLGVVLQPLADANSSEEEVPVVNFGSIGVVRCRVCRAYINPFVQWLENGRRWRCNLCQRDNETGAQYYSHLDANGQRMDRMERPELHKGCIEIVAPQEYLIRPPQPPVYVFVIDVSFEAVSSGMLACTVEAIKRSLDELPGSPRTQIAIVTYDYAVHFYSLNSELCQPKMFVVSDLDQLFLPCPEDLLVNLADSRDVVEMLLDSLPRIHGKNSSHEVAVGAAIQAAYRIMVHIGGKMMVFQTKLPSVGPGTLTAREDARLYDTDKEVNLLKSANAFYGNNGSEMCKNQVSVDLFLFPKGYCDLATVSMLPKTSGGQLHMYPQFNAQLHGSSLIADIERTLKRDTAWEAVVRLRASTGVRIKERGFYGNFLLRGADLLQVPNCDADATFAMELCHQESKGVLTTNAVTLQCALLYTASNGERRIRVMTSMFPVSTRLPEILSTADADAHISFVAKKAAAEVTQVGPSVVRGKLMTLCSNILRAGRLMGGSTPGYGGMPGMQQQQAAGQGLPPNLKLVPLYAMALYKNLAFRGGRDVSADERIHRLQVFTRSGIRMCLRSIYPHMYDMAAMTPDCGRKVAIPAGQTTAEPSVLKVDSNQQIKLPPLVNLSAANLRSDGIFLVDNGVSMQVWIGRGADPRLVQSLFGVPSLETIDAGVLRIERQPDDGDFKTRFLNIVDGLRSGNVSVHAPMQFCKEGDAKEARFKMNLIEDRAPFNGGSLAYDEFISHCQRLSTNNNTNK